MAIVERHISPDRALTLIVDLTDGDWTFGLDGFPWHTHGNILKAYGRTESPQAATRLFVDELIHSRRPLVVYRIDGKMHEVTVPDDYVDRPLGKDFARYALAGETMEIRFWDGTPAAG